MTTIELTHIGEDLIAAILNDLAKDRKLDRITCAVSNRSLLQDICDEEIGDSPVFLPEDAQLIVKSDKGEFTCDGKQKVDVLCAGRERAIAFESKLGETRLGPSAFRQRFCDPCGKSAHSDPRIKGNMIAVLERQRPFADASITAYADGETWTLAKYWWLVMRRKIVKQWLPPANIPVSSARILDFDTLAEIYSNGSKSRFEELVSRVVGYGFADAWHIPLASA